MSDLTFDFEDKLIKFIEENCGYNFNIEIKKDASGVHINRTIDKDAIFEKINDIEWTLVDMCNYEREHEQVELEDEIGNCCDDIKDLLEGE